MNFFAHQDQARRRTRSLLLLFVLAVLCILILTNAVVLVVVANTASEDDGLIIPDGRWVANHAGVVTATSVGVLLLVVGASGYRFARLAGGGGAVAAGMGGVLLASDPSDLAGKRLRNVVEEIAIAAGMPVPEIYVLEREGAINAFAAGLSTSDAAIAVSRGALDNLTRNELQGVIAHEFSHIANGDMRLNLRLVGVLFGILVIALAGRQVLRLGHHGRSRNALPVLAAGLALMIIGFAGLFFSRLIQAAVSRQRELLADASAVQFTRDPEGLGGALKKIAAWPQGSTLEADATEISHMLFAEGLTRRLFATHPPIDERIRALDPQFDSAELKDLRSRLELGDAGAEEPVRHSAGGPSAGLVAAGSVAAEPLAGQIGTLSWTQVEYAARLREALPDALMTGAHSVADTPDLLFALVLDRHPSVRERQLDTLRSLAGEDHARRTADWYEQVTQLEPQHRLPLVELALPTLKRRPRTALAIYLKAIERMIHADGEVAVSEFALYQVVRSYLLDSRRLDQGADEGRLSLRQIRADLALVLAVLATVGHQGEEAARRAFQQGWQRLFPMETETYRSPQPWTRAMETALARADRLGPLDKEALIGALVATLAHDGRITLEELELLRAICASLDCPMPPQLIVPRQAG